MKKFIKRLIVLSVMFLGVCSSIYACPVGMINAGACLPPDDPRLPQNQGPAPPPAPIWADRWGAIAFDGSNGTVGVAADALSKRKAQKVAIQDCQKRGGKGCSVKTTYYNQCAVVVTGDSDANFLNAPTIEQATKTGMDSCRARNDTNCRVYYSGCSMPVRVN